MGVSFEVQGNSTTALGQSYSDAVNTYAGAEPVPPARERGGLEPDGIVSSQNPKNTIAVESKYIEKWTASLYNPDLQVPFPHEAVENTIAQALKYAKAYPTGVDWYTNSIEFVRAYRIRFREAGIENFTFTIIPAARTKP